MSSEKMNPKVLTGIAIIWDGKAASSPLSAKLPRPALGPVRGVRVHFSPWKDVLMGAFLKRFFTLDFEGQFVGSFLKLLFLWNPLWTLLVTVFMGNRTLASMFFRWGWSLFEATCVVLSGLVLVRGYLSLERFWTLRAGKNPPRHGPGWHLLFLAFVAPLGLYASLRLMVTFINSFYGGDPIPFDFHWQYYGTEIFWVWSLLLVCFLFKSWLDLRDAARLSQIRAEELEKERLQALLRNLKDQMNPHFLFNTLNTVASLIHDDPAKAEKVVVKLSTIFQGLLAATRKGNHSLSEEMDFCRDYLEIEQVRFGPRLKVRMDRAKGLDASKIAVPVLLLQPLVENAVKHGLSSRASGGTLWVEAKARGGYLELRVEDDGVGFGNSPYAGSGTALENCRKRLELSYGKDGKMEISPREGGGTKIVLTMPLQPTDVKEEK